MDSLIQNPVWCWWVFHFKMKLAKLEKIYPVLRAPYFVTFFP